MTRKEKRRYERDEKRERGEARSLEKVEILIRYDSSGNMLRVGLRKRKRK